MKEGFNTLQKVFGGARSAEGKSSKRLSKGLLVRKKRRTITRMVVGERQLLDLR